MFSNLKRAVFSCAAIALASPAFGQVYAVTLTNPGSGYTAAPTVTASGGSCTTQPTFQAALSGAAVGTVAVTYAGICPVGGAVPTLAFSGGGGTGAAATAIMVQGSIALLDSPLVVSDTNPTPTLGGSYKLYRYECTLTVPAQFVPFYSLANASSVVDRMPNTSQNSQILWTVIQGAAPLQPLYTTAYNAGILTAYDGAAIYSTTATTATVEADVVTKCAGWQTALTAWNPWSNYGTFYNGTAWQTVTIQ